MQNRLKQCELNFVSISLCGIDGCIEARGSGRGGCACAASQVSNSTTGAGPTHTGGGNLALWSQTLLQELDRHTEAGAT